MTPERYRELLTAGPEITAEDWERMKKFTPKRKVMAVAVHHALNQLGEEAWIARINKRNLDK